DLPDSFRSLCAVIVLICNSAAPREMVSARHPPAKEQRRLASPPHAATSCIEERKTRDRAAGPERRTNRIHRRPAPQQCDAPRPCGLLPVAGGVGRHLHRPPRTNRRFLEQIVNSDRKKMT